MLILATLRYVVHCTIRNSSPQDLHICNYFDFGGSFRALVRKTVHLLGIWKILTENRWSTLLLRTNYIHSTLQQLIINIQTRTLIMKYIKALKKVCFIILFWFYQVKIRLIYFETSDVLPPIQFVYGLFQNIDCTFAKKIEYVNITFPINLEVLISNIIEKIKKGFYINLCISRRMLYFYLTKAYIVINTLSKSNTQDTKYQIFHTQVTSRNKKVLF